MFALVSLLHAATLADGRDANAAGNPAEAARIFQKLIPRYERRGEAMELAYACEGLGNALISLGDLPAARVQLERAVEVIEAAVGPDDPALASPLGSLGVVLYVTGDPARAVVHLERAIAVTDAHRDEHLDAWLKAWTNLGLARLALGDASAAIAAFHGVLSFEEERYGPNHPAVARALANAGYVYAVMRAWDRATPLLERAYTIFETTLGPEHPDTVQAVYNVATSVHAAGDVARAKGMYADAIARRARIVGPGDPALVQMRAAFANLLFYDRNFEAALPAFQAALADVDAQGSLAPTLRDQIAHGLAWSQVLLGDPSGARKTSTQWLATRTADVARGLAVVDDRQRIQLVGLARTALDVWLGTHEDPVGTYAEVLRWKGESARASLAARDELWLGKDRALRQAWTELAAVRGQLAHAALVGDDHEELHGLREEKHRLERVVARRSPAWTSATQPSPKEVCSTLPGGTAMVDYYRLHPFPPMEMSLVPADLHAYEAFVLRAGDCDRVVRVTLSNGDVIDALLERWRALLSAPGTLSRRIDAVGGPLREAVWDPLGLGGVDAVVIAPDGPLAGLPFAALPLADGRSLVEKVTIRYVEQASDLLRPAATPGEGALVVGGVAYSAPISGAALASRGRACSVGTFADLPGTAAEADEVAGLLGENVMRLGGHAADEANVRDAVQGKRIVHLATHGYFDGGECIGSTDDRAEHDWHRVLNPMVLSGLVLAGGNNGRAQGDDGIWTAEEVSSMDLRGTELVVLSACETGLGVAKSGEGLLGLRRAFSIAGVGTLVMSLWPVDDDATSRLMGAFYRHLPSASPAEALRAAQLELLAENRERFGEARPERWAAFVAAGGR